jgi:hypothetical protein
MGMDRGPRLRRIDSNLSTSNHIKVAAIYLHEHHGKSFRYIGNKFQVDHKTVSSWVQNREKIMNQNREDLIQMLWEINYGQREWLTQTTEPDGS